MDTLLTVPIVYTAIAVVLIVLFGLAPLVARAPTPATAAEAVAGVVRCLALSVFLIYYVPRYKKVFDDFGARLPAFTELVLTAADAAGAWFPMSAASLLLLAAAETALFGRLHHDPAKRTAARWVSILATAASAATLIVMSIALVLPLLRFLNDLS